MSDLNFQLIYLVDSPHHLWAYQTRRILEWIVARPAAPTKYLLASNFNTVEFVKWLPAQLQKLMLPVFPFEEKKTQIFTILEDYAQLRSFARQPYPGEDILLYDILFPDRLLYYLSSVECDTSMQSVFSEYFINQVHLIGSSTDNPAATWSLVQAIKSKQIPLTGYPLANVVGRYAPSWLNACDQVFVERAEDVTALQRDEAFSSTVSLFHPAKLPQDQTPASTEYVIFDVGIHTPRHDLLKLLQQHLSVTPPENILIHTHLSPAFIDFLQKYLAAHGLPALSVGNHFRSLFSARKILSFFPFSAYYLLQNFAGNFPVYVVDLSRRYIKIDGLIFSDSELFTVENPKEPTGL